MTDAEQRAAAKQFIRDWTGRGDEKQDTQSFWLTLLSKVCGVEEPASAIAFEVPVQLSHTSFIDGYMEETRVLIEQKGQDIDLRRGYRQSDGSMLTPYQQARRYAGYLPHNKNPRWIIVCNFKEFDIYDNNNPNGEPEIVLLSDLERDYKRLSFLTDGKHTFKVGMDSCCVPGILNFCHNVIPEAIDTCEGARFSCYIDAQMNIVPCSFDQDKRFAISLRSSTIEQAWNSKEFDLFRKSLRFRCLDCTKRENCMGGCPLSPEIVLCNNEDKHKGEPV